MAQNALTAAATEKCKCKGYPSFSPAQLMEQCGNSKCLKRNLTKIMQFWRIRYIVTLDIRRVMSKNIRTDNLTWSNDGAGGKNNARSSEILIDYLNTDKKFANWPHAADRV